MSTDLKGRSYARFDQVNVGTKLTFDEDFTCLSVKDVREVEADDEGLYVKCADGKHYLDGQFSDDGTYYIGVYLVQEVD